jgi:hypothetical protein
VSDAGRVGPRGPVRLLALRAEGGPRGASAAFGELERRIGSLRGRRFVGVFDEAKGTYWAGVVPVAGDDASRLGLEAVDVPAGDYAQRTLVGWKARPASIGEAFVAMTKAHSFDASRPSVELYRRDDEVDLWLPVLPGAPRT